MKRKVTRAPEQKLKEVEKTARHWHKKYVQYFKAYQRLRRQVDEQFGICGPF